MPELPEVETTRRGLLPHVAGCLVSGVTVHEGRLRIPVPENLESLGGQKIRDIHRRAKYLIFEMDQGWLVVHLGMSGSLRISGEEAPLRKHDHIVIGLDAGRQIRFHDPRRFGLVDLTSGDWEEMNWFRNLGPEPLGNDFDGGYLAAKARGRKGAVKTFIMTNQVVVGVGNIYACEALFQAGIHPGRAAGKVSRLRFDKLALAIKDRLAAAIESGGTTLRDFVREEGQPGYFQQELMVYGREGELCRICHSVVKRRVIGQRSSFYCPGCQH